jgi:endo-1,4-beta-xylanase
MRPALPLLCLIVAAAGCRQVTIVADEIARDSATQPDTRTETETESATDTDTGSDTDTGRETDSETDTTEICPLPDTFSWTSSGMLVGPPADVVSIKDPTVVLFNERWYVYATTIDEAGLNMTFFSFADWTEAPTATLTPASSNANLTGYKAAPQLFYFSPNQTWYLVYQTPEPAYSISREPGNLQSWSAMTRFMDMPALITDAGDSGIDYWVICDDADCYMFFSALNGILYRARTTKAAFPDGFEGTTEIAMQDETLLLHDSSNVYRVAGADQYLLLVSAIGAVGRYFRAWTADRLDGDWTPFADTPEHPFASRLNVTGAEWATDGINHGEMLRRNPDETMTIDPCHLEYFYSGLVREDADTEQTFYGLGLLSPETARR